MHKLISLLSLFTAGGGSNKGRSKHLSANNGGAKFQCEPSERGGQNFSAHRFEGSPEAPKNVPKIFHTILLLLSMSPVSVKFH